MFCFSGLVGLYCVRCSLNTDNNRSVEKVFDYNVFEHYFNILLRVFQQRILTLKIILMGFK